MKKHIKKVTSIATKPIKAVHRVVRRKRTPEEEELSIIPRITNETLAQHREEILKGARKFIYPLQHSKHKVVLISFAIGFLSIVGFFSYTALALYKFHSSSDFLYRVTKVIPFPVAKVKGRYVAYENYLFELKHYIHYYQVQQKVDFTTASGKQQLKEAKSQLLQQVIDKAYIKIIAEEKGISVSDADVENQIKTLRDNSRLGGSNKVYLDVLKNWYNWSESDFKREVKDQLLAQKLVSALDTDTKARAQAALDELNAGKDFGEVAAKYSDDVLSKDQKGDLGIIDKAARDVPVNTVDALYKLQPGQFSATPVDLGYGLEIVKNIELKDDKVHGAHILFYYKDISTLINDYKEKNKYQKWINL